MPIREIVQDMTETTATLKLDQDNQATITTNTHEVTSWRTASRAAGIRDLIAEQGIIVEHVQRVSIIGDPLTRVLPKVKLIESYDKLQLIRHRQSSL